MWLRPICAAASATCCGSCLSTARGMPVLTLQNAQARVQVSPRIMTVACFLVQHSPMLGHAASSQTVARFLDRINRLVSAKPALVGALTRIQSGLRCRSGRALSGSMRLISFMLRSEEHTSELQSLMRISYAVFCLKKKKHKH